MEKKLIEIAKRYVDCCYMQGSVSEVSKNLYKLESEFKDKVETDGQIPNLTIQLEADYSDYNDKQFYLKAYREETDSEYKLRLDVKQAQEDKVRERELQTLAKLKAKYGDVS